MMNPTMMDIRNRRSIRKFKDVQIPEPVMKEIVESGIYAPNARNQQKWHFTVIQDKATLTKMVEIIKENILKSDIEFLKQRAKSPDYNTFHSAPAVILVTAEEETRFVELDCGAAMQNMALAAESHKVGTCVITSSEFLFASNKEKVREMLGVPERYDHVCMIALGYLDGEKPAMPPRNMDVINYI
jgi:nitroreductase